MKRRNDFRPFSEAMTVPDRMPEPKKITGFTLIELSVVLVIIGLIIGGVLTGQDLIRAAAERSQITQIEKYDQAVVTFKSKYGQLPGDISDPDASSFGFQSRGSAQGQGDGNGIIEGYTGPCFTGANGMVQGIGETAVFWQDLSTAGLINFKVPVGANYPSVSSNYNITLTSTPSLLGWVPVAKVGATDFVYLYSLAGLNYFAVSSVTKIGCAIESTVGANIPVKQAYDIDAKIDDGLPQSGNVTACYVNYDVVHYSGVWSAAGVLQGASGGANCVPTTAATAPATTNCYDNNNAVGPQQYSILQNASQANCALSFKIQ